MDGFHIWLSCLPLLWFLCRRQLPPRYRRQCRPQRKTLPRGTTICSLRALQQITSSGARTSSECLFSSDPRDTWCTNRAFGWKGNGVGQWQVPFGSLGHSRGWTFFAGGNRTTRGSGEVQLSPRLVAGRLVLPVRYLVSEGDGLACIKASIFMCCGGSNNLQVVSGLKKGLCRTQL